MQLLLNNEYLTLFRSIESYLDARSAARLPEAGRHLFELLQQLASPHVSHGRDVHLVSTGVHSTNDAGGDFDAPRGDDSSLHRVVFVRDIP